MEKILRVRISEYQIAQSGILLKSYGLGSCIGVVIWDAEKKLGAMAHILLPYSKNSDGNRSSARYAGNAVAILIQELIKAGADKKRLVAKIAGGANMFSAKFNPPDKELQAEIGARNIRAVRKALSQNGIPLVAQEVGGELGRTIEFDPGTGALLIYKSNGEGKII